MNFKAFISYSHRDKRYFKLLINGLKAHSKNSNIFDWEFWDDRNIALGTDWHETIQHQIKECDFAILLISADFLNSEYVEKHELEEFIKKQAENGFLFFPVLVRDCEFVTIQKLAKIQFFTTFGEDYGLPKKEGELISFSELARYDTEGVLIPNPYFDTYYKNLIKAIEQTIKEKYLEKEMKTKKMPGLFSIFMRLKGQSIDIILQSSRFVILYFDCEKVASHTYIMLKIAQNYKNKIQVYFINIEEEFIVIPELRIRNTPTVVFYKNSLLFDKIEKNIDEYMCFNLIREFTKEV